MTVFPLEIVEQFRTAALERLKRIEASWTALTESGDGDGQAVMHREAHNLKGESRLIGFADVNLLCHKLEDLFALAGDRHYKVGEDFDLAVTMTTRFMAMLVRKKVGTHAGIDLPGFLGHLDEVIADTVAFPPSAPASQTQRSSHRIRIPLEARERAGIAAVDVFIEAARGRGGRLDTAWRQLRDLLAIDELVPLRPNLEKHRDSSIALLRELGRSAHVEFDLGEFDVISEVVGVLDVALLHLLRNAIDHGIEPSSRRLAKGKPPTGRITVRSKLIKQTVTLTVSDDGSGIDYELVRARGLGLGWLDVASAANATQDELKGLLMRTGFSTRTRATDVSGRGVGLDAVSTAVTSIGGALQVESSSEGTNWLVEASMPDVLVAAHAFRVPGISVPFAIRTDWEPCDSTTVFVDLAVALGLGGPTLGEVRFAVRRGSRTVGFVAGETPHETSIRRLVTTPSCAIAEVALIDGVEGLLLRPERLR